MYMNKNNTTSNDTNSNLNITAITESAQDFVQFSLDELGPDLVSLLDQFLQSESESIETDDEVGQILIEQYCIKWNLSCFEQDGYLYISPKHDRNQGIIAIDTSDLVESVRDYEFLIRYISIFSNMHCYETGRNRLYWAESYPKTEDGRYQMVITLPVDYQSTIDLIMTSDDLVMLELIEAKLALSGNFEPWMGGADKSHLFFANSTLSLAGISQVMKDMEWSNVEWTWSDITTY
jgi:hypothetical protein